MAYKKLKYCPFCGDTSPYLESGRDKFLSMKDGLMFQAQVHCSHCCATGTLIGGQDRVEDAVNSAIRYWNEAGRS